MSKSKTELSVPETARRLGYTMGWVYSMVYIGKLPATKVAGRWRIPVSAVEDIELRRQARQ